MKKLILSTEILGDSINLSQEDSHYLSTVLRMNPGESLNLVDSVGLEYRALLVSVDKKGAICRIQERLPDSKTEATVSVDLWLPLLKGEKIDLVVQKAVELGAATITLWAAKRSIVKPSGKEEKKLARWETIAKNASQQCGRTKVPEIRGIFELKQAPESGSRFFAWESERDAGLREALKGCSESALLLTGPEGGLDPGEAEFLLKQGFQPVTLGPRILRAETAAITLLACTMFALGQME